MTSSRLEAFSDGVLAIIITIMVLAMQIPATDDIQALLGLVPNLIAYVLSYVYVGIYWNNHHHLMKTATTINGKVLWANLAWLFWLSLVPVATGWMSQFYTSVLPVFSYGVVLLMSGITYVILQQQIVKANGVDHVLRQALGNDWKGRASLFGYVLSLVVSLFAPVVAIVGYALIAVVWFIPDRRIEEIINE